MEMSVSLSRRRQPPWHGFWEGGRENEQANAGQPGFAGMPVLRKRRSRRRLPCQPAPPPRPNRHPQPCPPGQSAVSNASPAGFITPDPALASRQAGQLREHGRRAGRRCAREEGRRRRARLHNAHAAPPWALRRHLPAPRSWRRRWAAKRRWRQHRHLGVLGREAQEIPGARAE